MRKNPDPEMYSQVWKNARVDDPDYTKYLLIGNSFAHRNRFMVISILRVKDSPQLLLF